MSDQFQYTSFVQTEKLFCISDTKIKWIEQNNQNKTHSFNLVSVFLTTVRFSIISNAGNKLITDVLYLKKYVANFIKLIERDEFHKNLQKSDFSQISCFDGISSVFFLDDKGLGTKLRFSYLGKALVLRYKSNSHFGNY